MPDITDTEIDAMEAGTAMDTLVAERVMGIVPRDVRVKAAADIFVRVWCPDLCDGRWTYGQLCVYGSPMPYSTDIAASWKILAEMQKRGWTYSIGNSHDYPNVTAFFYRPWKEYPLGRSRRFARQATAPDAPLAICRAALAACAAWDRLKHPKPLAQQEARDAD